MLGNFLFIFFARLVDVSLMTMRTLLVVRGKRHLAALLGFIEVTIYIVALGQVFRNLNDWTSILAYSSGFAAGNYLGSYIEEKMAMGFLNLQVISKDYASNLVDSLRSHGYGVTVVEGRGRVGTRQILYIAVKRRDQAQVMGLIDAADPDAFITILDARTVRGGFLAGRRER